MTTPPPPPPPAPASAAAAARRPIPPPPPPPLSRSSQPAPLRKSTTSSSQRSGEITIMLDPALPAMPRPKSTSQLPPQAPSTLPTPILRLPSNATPAPPSDPPLHDPKHGLKSRYFQQDRSSSIALNSPSSLIPSSGVLSPNTNTSPSSTEASTHSRSRSQSTTPAPLPPPANLPRPETVPMQPAKSDIPAIVTTLNDDMPRPVEPPTRPYDFLTTPYQELVPPVSPLSIRHKRAHSASDFSSDPRKSMAVSAISESSGHRRNQSSSSTMTTFASLQAPSPALPAFPSGAPSYRHNRNQSSLSAISAMSQKDLAAGQPSQDSSARHTMASTAESRRITKGRLKDPLPQPPPVSPPQARASIASAQSKGSSLLERIGTLSSRLGRRDPSKYQKLDDMHEETITMQDMDRVRTAETEAPIGVDISTFMGPNHGSPGARVKYPKRSPTLHMRTGEDDILEAKGHLTGGLGIGMSDIVTRTIEVPASTTDTSYLKSPTKSIWMRGGSSPSGHTQLGQKAAESEGAVVAIEETVPVDLSNVEGGQETPAGQGVLDLMAQDTIKQSYYFPADPEMPNWRPVTMRAWWICALIVLALAFVAVIEVLVRLGGRPDGLMNFVDPDKDVSTGDWFVWKYLPEAIFVTYGILFQATDFEVRRLEPYYQMSQPTGAKAEEALNMDYLTFWSYLIPFKAFKHRQWAVLHSSVATILSSALVPVLFSAALNMDPERGKRKPTDRKYVRMDAVWSRLLEATLLIVAIEATLLLIQLRRKSGLVSNPRGIAGIAAMATKSHILNDFRGLDMASHRVIHKHLAHRRYILHKSSLWQGEYITCTSTSDPSHSHRPENPHPMALHLYFVLFFTLFLLFFVVFIPIVEFNPTANIITDKAPWFLTLLATLIKLMWTNLETAVRLLQPFYVLSRRHAAPRTLLLDYTGTVPGYMPLKAATNRHFLLAAVGTGSLLCEILTVVASSFNIDGRSAIASTNAGGGVETRRSYLASLALAVAIPLLLLAVLAAVFLRRRHPFLPRQPGTIASVLAFLAQSKMLYDFAAADELQGRGGDAAPGTVRALEAKGKLYGLGWYRGRDGTDHLGIDEEELLAEYRHGKDWSKGRVELGEVGRWENL